MNELIKKLESAVAESLETLQSVGVKTNHHKYTNHRKGTHLNINIAFNCEDELKWVSTGLQWGDEYQFTIMFNLGICGDWYKHVEFGSSFYDSSEVAQSRRVAYFLKNYSKLVSMVVDDINMKRKRELLAKQREIQEELASL